MQKILKKKRIQYKQMYKDLKEELFNELNLYGYNTKILKSSVTYCDILRHNSYKNYLKLSKLQEDNLIYKDYYRYTKNYENITYALYNKIMTRKDNKSLVIVNNYIKYSIDNLNRKNENLLKVLKK